MEDCVEWMLEHAEDEDINEPIPPNFTASNASSSRSGGGGGGGGGNEGAFASAMSSAMQDMLMAALVGLMLGSLRVLWPWPNGVGVISEDQTEVIDGTGLEWPAEAGDWVGPSVLALIAVVVVLGVARIGARYAPD